MKYISIGFLLLLVSCENSNQNALDELAFMHPALKIVSLNTHGGYKINPLTGDSIKPLINSLGDTVKTGVPIPVKGKVINPSSISMPKVVPAGIPEVITVPRYVHKIPENLTVIPVNWDSLKTFTPGKDSAPGIVPVIAEKKVVPCRKPRPIQALPPVVKDNAMIPIKCLDVDQGMIHTGIWAILEDHQGNIWFGSGGNGVSKYDGSTFTHFGQKEGLSNNLISSMLEDSLGNIWIGTFSGGVNIYNGEGFLHLTEEEGLCSNWVKSMLMDSNGNFWFGSESRGVSFYNGEAFVNYTEKEGLSSENVTCMLEDRQGVVWFGTQDGGVSIFDGNTFTYLTREEGLISNHIGALYEDSSGNFWIGTDKGLCKYDGETITHYTQKEGLVDQWVVSIQEDSYGILWFGIFGGVSMYDGESFTDFTYDIGLSDYRITFIMEDSHGSLWFGTTGGGVSIYRRNPFTHLTRREGLRHNHATSLVEDSQGTLWVGSTDGLSRYDGESSAHFTSGEGLIHDFIWSILEDKHKNLWFGTRNGVSRYDGETFTQFTQREGLSDPFVRMILEDKDGNLWFCTHEGGLSRYNGTSFTQFTENEGLSDNHVRYGLEDSHGNLWFGSFKGGVSMYDGETLTHLTEKEGLSCNNVQSILEDSKGNLWFGTRGGGVNMFNGETFRYFTKKEGLSDNCITSLVEDSKQGIWVSTMRGLNLIVFEEESNPDAYIYSYGVQDGLKGISFLRNSVCKVGKSNIWLGTRKCVTVVDINHLDIPDNPPANMHLNLLEIDRHFVDYRHMDETVRYRIEFDHVHSSYNYPVDLVLPYNTNDLTFHYSAADWLAHPKIRYSYQMVGLEDSWNMPVAEAYADYRNMPPGKYIFKVRAIGAAQKWSESFEYAFTISPPFWFSWWAYVFYGILLLLLVRWYRAFLINREKMNADLRVREAEVSKMKEIDHMKSRFFANISHEFRTPLTLIYGPVEELRKQFKVKEEGSSQLFVTVKRNINRLQELINQLLDISRLETGNVNLQVCRGDLVAYIKSIVLSFLSLADYKKIKYEYEFPDEVRLVYFDSDKIDKIMNNLISNAFKFTSRNGRIWIGIRFLHGDQTDTIESVEIRVSDTGKGIPMEMQNKIFDRFYQVRDSVNGETEGTGLGLALTKELIELYRGDIRVSSEVGKGSTFTVQLPVSDSDFKEGEISDDLLDTEHMKVPLETAGAEMHLNNNILESQILDRIRDKSEILIVEDNEDLREYMSRNLGRSYQILLAENGKKGLDKALEHIPDLIISDVMMPVMDGMEMCKRLKTNESTDHIPVVMLTARADKDSKLEGLETGADDYLVKPFDAEELEARVRNLLEQRKRLREKFRLEFLGTGLDAGIPIEQQFIRKLIDIFQGHISDSDFKMDQISLELHLSQSQVRRKVMALTGYSPNELFRNHRLKNAAILFRDGHTHVAQVMHLVGFNNQSYFSKCFGELFQRTPSQYIASLK